MNRIATTLAQAAAAAVLGTAALGAAAQRADHHLAHELRVHLDGHQPDHPAPPAGELLRRAVEDVAHVRGQADDLVADRARHAGAVVEGAGGGHPGHAGLARDLGEGGRAAGHVDPYDT